MKFIDGNKIMFIVYVEKQKTSKLFYQEILSLTPILDVPGMTEFQLADNVILGIMPGESIVKILENKVNSPNEIKDTPRCELYLYVDNEPFSVFWTLFRERRLRIT